MRRHVIFLASLLLVASCTDSTQPTRSFTTGPSDRYQLSQSGSLSDEIHALIAALFPQGLETAAGTRWEHIELRVATGDHATARRQLLELAQWIVAKQPQMDTPPHGESREAASARLILYMSLYVYGGPTTPTPSSFGSGADAVVAIVAPDAETTVQTPRRHAGARFDAGSVSASTIVVISQNTEFYQSHCSGPFTTQYCQYPLFYRYNSFPKQRFLKPVHLAVCTLETGRSYGALPGQDHDGFVLAHDKPADSTYYTPGGYPVPGESIELLPRNPNYDPTRPLTHCDDAAYPQVATVAYAPSAPGVVGTALAHAARGVNRTIAALTAVVTPTLAYAVDNGAETDTYTFSDFAHVDTTGRPDLAVSQTSASASSVEAGQSVTLTYRLENVGTAPSPTQSAVVRLIGPAPQSQAVVIASPPTAPGTLFPLDSRVQTLAVTIPAHTPTGSYTIAPVVTSVGGLEEPGSSLANNSAGVTLQVTSSAQPASPFGRHASATVDGTFAPGEWDETRCAALDVSIPGGGTSAGKLCWQNDNTTMFFGLRFASSIDIVQASLGIEFDRDSSSSSSVADDVVVANRQIGFFDNVRVPCQINHDAICAPADSTVGGTSDGVQGWSYSNGMVTAEMSHPLNSGDAHDLALTAGSAVGITANVRLIIQSMLTDTRYPGSGHASMQTYAAPTPGGPFFARGAAAAAGAVTRPTRRAVVRPAGRPLRSGGPAGTLTP